MTKVTNFKEQEPALDLAMREFIASTISTASRTMAATFRMAPAYTLSMLIRRCIGYLMVYDAMATADYLEALAQEARGTDAYAAQQGAFQRIVNAAELTDRIAMGQA
ncbi:hypothetical protein [Seohaeicola zhoushanensis]|uniref:Uncharacterized protein n=1 Tax=Seohaeicola zhoushanensis TaxID=1569283 RepID=A0A8J3H1G3_9RHOB|nr:hypothetical protein [Seohaeicola zhoushanensis]GHF70962.1 hypothetical protein GCM10017056_47340 [Seohaeicola zhoushanensis]